jgi:hypothetical protein
MQQAHRHCRIVEFDSHDNLESDSHKIEVDIDDISIHEGCIYGIIKA